LSPSTATSRNPTNLLSGYQAEAVGAVATLPFCRYYVTSGEFSWARMKDTAVTTLVIIAAIACVGSLAAFLIALFPWSILLLGIPIFAVVCISVAKARQRLG